MREFTVYAPAKLNLYLDVLDKRPDGYHNIITLFEKIDLKDEIVIKPRPGSGISIEVEPSLCPPDETNIVYRALQSLFKETTFHPGVEIFIRKNIPMAAGLGGGSSDAATVLRAVNERFNLGVMADRLHSIATDIGKDVPFFMTDMPFAVGRGAGEVLEAVGDADFCLSHVILRPDVAVSTERMYERLDRCGYTPPRRECLESMVSAIKTQDIGLLKKSCYNIFESVISDATNFVERARRLLLNAGVESAFLSGSGPSVFCITGDRREAMQILKQIPKEEGISSYIATTYKGGIYGDN